jgi:hypothetical protein
MGVPVARADTCPREYARILATELQARDQSLGLQEKMLHTRYETLRRDPPLVRDRSGNTVLDKIHARELMGDIVSESKLGQKMIAKLRALEADRLRYAQPEYAVAIHEEYRSRIEGVEQTLGKLKELARTILRFGDPYENPQAK